MDQSTTERVPHVASPPRIGHLLGSRYELYDEVGSGPLAHVYAAWDQQFAHRVAAKILDSQFLHRREIVEAFDREARRAGRLPTHRNIVPVHDVEVEGPFPYIVSEYVPGHSVRSMLGGAALVSVELAFEICRQVAQGLDFAHEYGVVHGNIKPENILLSPNGQVKVTDFGLGYATEIAESLGALPPAARGPYMSPEQTLGRKLGPASDVYSLGLVLVEMLTGKVPSGPEDVLSILGEHARSSSYEPQPLRHAIPPAARRIVLRAVARDPAARYRSAGAFASALHQYLLLEAGSTMPFLPSREGGDGIFPDVFEQPRTGLPAPLNLAVPHSSSAHAIRRDAGSSHPHRLTLTGLVFVIVLAAAAAGGWLAYRAVSDLLKQWGVPPAAGAVWTIRHAQSAHLASPTHATVAIAPRTYPCVGVLSMSKNVEA